MKAINLVKLACFSLVFASTVAQAAPACDNFKIIVKNQSPDRLLGEVVKVEGALITPDGINALNSDGTAEFTIKGSTEAEVITGKIELHSETAHDKQAAIKFKLSNDGLICHHTDDTNHTGKNGYLIEDVRLPNQVVYTIK